ncbi:hypothetical protein NDU88_004287 [Pleurodeles waltl]|uniref:Uncharacterized protein n=1 Tax=Pleurodeles waltl TaxID=8319 RepID=A0AAV7UF30_PLEWA|nr:hypothetical protein NDU88_004287 [Pleurodeles waltl]
MFSGTPGRRGYYLTNKWGACPLLTHGSWLGESPRVERAEKRTGSSPQADHRPAVPRPSSVASLGFKFSV